MILIPMAKKQQKKKIKHRRPCDFISNKDKKMLDLMNEGITAAFPDKEARIRYIRALRQSLKDTHEITHGK